MKANACYISTRMNAWTAGPANQSARSRPSFMKTTRQQNGLTTTTPMLSSLTISALQAALPNWESAPRPTRWLPNCHYRVQHDNLERRRHELRAPTASRAAMKCSRGKTHDDYFRTTGTSLADR